MSKIRLNIKTFKLQAAKIISFILHICFLAHRPVTLGARVLIRFGDNHFILVKHTYNSFWCLPGGGVNVGECSEEAAKREVNEEIGLNINESLSLLTIKYNKAVSRRDHVVFFHVYLQQLTSLKAKDLRLKKSVNLQFIHCQKKWTLYH